MPDFCGAAVPGDWKPTDMLGPLVDADEQAAVIAIVIVIDGHVLRICRRLVRQSRDAEMGDVDRTVDAARALNVRQRALPRSEREGQTVHPGRIRRVHDIRRFHGRRCGYDTSTAAAAACGQDYQG